MSQSNRMPSSLSSGFFQALPSIPPQYSSAGQNAQIGESYLSKDGDPILPRILQLYFPSPLPTEIDSALHDFARTCLDGETLRLTVNCETDQPTLHSLDTFGQDNKLNPLHTSEGWRRLKDIQTRAGVVVLGYASPPSAQRNRSLSNPDLVWNRRIHQFSVNHLWAGSAALVTCPAAMTDGAATLLSRHLDDPDGDQPGRAKVFREAQRRLVSFDPSYAWTSGQWMTERTGGSDVSETETLAKRLTEAEMNEDNKVHGNARDAIGMPLGPWRIDGFKWFSSATDADMAVLLARTNRGISAFYAPLRRMSQNVPRSTSQVEYQPILNGIRISRLKNKLGTKGLPTAELEIQGMRAWLIGEEGRGVKEISAILNSTRLWTANGAIGYWARGLAISRAYAKVRKVKGGKLLCENKQHVRWMANETVKYRALAHLTFLGVALMGVAEQGSIVVEGTKATRFLPTDAKEAQMLLRTLTPLMKAQCSLHAIHGLRECMESLGGVGYCENNEDGGVMNVARLFRDANVNSIWEGTTSIMAEDLIRVLKGRTGSESMNALERLIERLLQTKSDDAAELSRAAWRQWEAFKTIVNELDTETTLCRGRETLQCLQNVICAGLLISDAEIDHDTLAMTVAGRWVELCAGPTSDFRAAKAQPISIDQVVFLGDAGRALSSARAKI